MKNIVISTIAIFWIIFLIILMLNVELPKVSSGIVFSAIILNFIACVFSLFKLKSNKKINENSASAKLPEINYARSYWLIVWTQLKKNRLAIFGLFIIILLLLTAITAPVISHNKPFLRQDYSLEEFSPTQLNQYFSDDFETSEINMKINAGQVQSRIWSPWLESLFDKNVFPQGVDIFFNSFLLVLILILIFFPSLLFVRIQILAQIKKFNRKAVLSFIISGFLMFFVVNLLSKNFTQLPSKYYTDQATKTTDFNNNELNEVLYNDNKISQKLESQVQRLIVQPLLVFSNSEGNLEESLEKPSSKHILGTTDTGKDVLSVMIYGLRISLTIGVIAVSIYCFIGILIGAIAGYFGGWADILLSRFIEVMICFPAMYLLLTLVVVIPKVNIFYIMLIIGITRWTGPARLIRGEFLKQRTYDYVIAAKALGLKPSRIIFRHILPNAMTPLLVTATFGIAAAILTESGLSFLGLGPTDVETWGFLLKLGRSKWETHLILPAGFAIFVTVLVFNFVGEGLRDALDPKLKQ